MILGLQHSEFLHSPALLQSKYEGNQKTPTQHRISHKIHESLMAKVEEKTLGWILELPFFFLPF